MTQQTYDNWMAHYLHTGAEMALPLPERVGLTMKRMYREATLTGDDVGHPNTPWDALAEDPYRAVWWYCGSSTFLFNHVLQCYGYKSTWQELWHHKNNYHVACEYVRDNETYYYDPLYGYHVKSAASKRLDIRTIAVHHQHHSVVPEAIEAYAPAAHAGYEFFNAYNYSTFLNNYLHAIVYKDGDYNQTGDGFVILLKRDPAIPPEYELTPEWIRGEFPGVNMSIYTLDP